VRIISYCSQLSQFLAHHRFHRHPGVVVSRITCILSPTHIQNLKPLRRSISFLYYFPHMFRPKKFLVIYLRSSLLLSRHYSLRTKCVERKRKYVSGFDSCLVVEGENDVTPPWYADSVTCIRRVIASCFTPSCYSLLQSDGGCLYVISVKCTVVQVLRLCTGRTAPRGSTGMALLFHDHGTRRG